MDAKVITRGESTGQIEHEAKDLIFDFGGKYAQYDVCTEIGLDATLFGKENGLKKIREILVPQVQALGEKNLQAENLNEKQLIDKLIEAKIESRCF